MLLLGSAALGGATAVESGVFERFQKLLHVLRLGVVHPADPESTGKPQFVSARCSKAQRVGIEWY